MATEAENLISEGLQEQSTAETEISVTSETQAAVETKPVNIAMETEKGTDINKVQEQLHEEVRMLKDKLKQTEQTVVKTQANLRLQQTRTKQLISIWKTHVERNEQNLKRQGMVRDQQLGEVISQLLFFEGQLRKEQKRILSLLADKDKIIEQQDKHILDLQVQNSKLLEALEDVKNMSNKNGIIQGVFMSQGQGNGYATGADNSAFSFDISIPADIVPSHKAPQKSGGRFNAVKDRLRRHKSNLELRNIENTIFEETAEELSLSQENVVCRRSNPRRTSRERCKSIAGYPVSTDRGLEDCDLSTSQLDNEISLYEKELDRVADANNSNSDYSDTSSYSASSHLGFDESENLSDSNKLETSAQSMLNVSDLSDYDLKKISGKDRVRSVSSSDVRMTSNSSKDPLKSGKTDSQKSVQAEGKSSPISEYNPFKSFKSMLKRRGSKQKKKRAVSLQQTTNMEYYEALKYHLDKDSKSKKGH